MDENEIERIVLTSRSMQSAQKGIDQLNISKTVSIIPMILDLEDKNSICNFVEKYAKIVGSFDIFVNNAGIAAELWNKEDNKVQNLVSTVNTNYSGTRQVLDTGRKVNYFIFILAYRTDASSGE